MIYTTDCIKSTFHPTIYSIAPILLVENHPLVGAMNPQGWTRSYGCLQSTITIQIPTRTQLHDSYNNTNHTDLFPISLHNTRDDISFYALYSLKQFPSPPGLQHNPARNLSTRGSKKSIYNRSSHTSISLGLR